MTCVQLRGAALSIVGDDGIESLTLDRLADRAGLSVDEARQHYPDLTECLYETYEEVSSSIYEDFVRCFAEEPRWRSALTLGGRTLLERMAANPAEARLCFFDILRGDHELLRRREAARRRLVDLFVVELGRRRGEPEQFRIQLELLIGAAFQAIAAAVATGGLDELPRLERELESRAFVFEPVPTA
jgi:AcrR family transcriptional regulator